MRNERNCGNLSLCFKVKVEVSDGDAVCTFVIFDSYMCYIMEKSCAHLAGKSKVPNGGPCPAEFQSLVKRVCMDSYIIKKFCADGDFFTPVKTMSQVIDLGSDNDGDAVDFVEDSQPLAFMKDTFLTHVLAKSPDKEVAAVNTVKRNLSEVFDSVLKVEGRKSLRRVKIEKE
ncbi:hypothetical protein QL285_078010 [Trifolium repens]|nr:hypothetical protein QL285_078010 [Trifolium repens]